MFVIIIVAIEIQNFVRGTFPRVSFLLKRLFVLRTVAFIYTAMYEDSVVKELELQSLSDIYDREEDFSAMLSKHLDRLGLGRFTDIQLEVPTDNRIADIVATRNYSDERLVIENQFGNADWDHWGRLEGYARHHDVTIAVLIAEGFEHLMILACRERNIESPISWYLIQIEVTIRDEFLFRNIVEPTSTDLDAANERLRRRIFRIKPPKLYAKGEGDTAFWQPIRDDKSCLFAGKTLAPTNKRGIVKKVRGKGIRINLVLLNECSRIRLLFDGDNRKTRRNNAKKLFADYDKTCKSVDLVSEAGLDFDITDKGRHDIDYWDPIRESLVTEGTYIYERVQSADL